MSNEYYLGGWNESNLSFSSAIQHTNSLDEYYDEVFSYKYAGNISKEYRNKYNWLRNPNNLIIAFNTAKVIGLEKLISKEKYFSKENHFYSGEWEDKSLNNIVSQFLTSDTSLNSQKKNYFTKFWNRRRIEGTFHESYSILKEIDSFYNKSIISKSSVINDTLKKLLEYDYLVKTSDSTNYRKSIYQYFNYLKKIKMEHSAYDLIHYDYATNIYNIELKNDSLISTLQLDTISYEEWESEYQKRWIDYSNYEGP